MMKLSSFGVCIIVVSTLATVARAISILNGDFQTTTDVQDYLNLAHYAAAMREAGDMATKKQIYTQGLDSSGGTATITLQSLSLNAGSEMSASPMFNIFRYAFLVLGSVTEGETEGTFDGNPIEQYADTLVNDLFALDIMDIETEAAIVHNVWMACVHQLFQVLIECRANDAVKGIAALEKAVALWVGADQVPGGNDQGHLLYELAESAGERFGQDDGVSWVNQQLMQRFTSIQTDFSESCNGDQDGYRDLRQTIRRMIGLMTVPLVQNFIHHSFRIQSTGETNKFVELYALAIIPRLAACDRDAFNKELDLDVVVDLQPSQVSATIQAIQETYHCLEITCQDIGSYMGGVVPECQDNTTVTAAGYSSNRVGLTGPSTLDRDIMAIDIFLRFEAYGAAEDWYIHGWNSEHSLQSLARNQFVPALTDGNSYIDTFQEYYQDIDFADNMIINAIDQVPPFNSATKEQIRAVVVGVLKYVVIFMTSAASLQYAVQQCAINQTVALNSWDAGAFLYIGSMEGPAVGGSYLSGEFLYSTAKKLCKEFGTCVDDGSGNGGINDAAANTQIVDALNRVVSKISAGSCEDIAELLTFDIFPAMNVPLIQGTIKYASLNSALSAGTSDVGLAIGDTFAKGILPIIEQADVTSAVTIQSNMEFQLSSKPVAGGFQAIADALRIALGNMATSCDEIGQFQGEPTDGDLCQSGGDDATEPVASPTRAPDVVSGSNLAWGRYNFKSEEAVKDADFALDIRDMWESDATADTLYSSGKNVAHGLMNRPDVNSLSALSKGMVDAMRLDPIYNIYMYSLYDERYFDGNTEETFSFGDDVVIEALVDGQNNQLAAKAVVVLNVWHMIVHRLYEANRVCNSVGGDPAPFVDSAVALWIGQEQGEATSESGWMVYHLAEVSNKAFGLEGTEAKLNTELMQRFNELQVSAGKCNTASGRLDFYYLVNEQIQALSKVLVLAFLSVLYGGSTNLVELYAVAVLPQAVACDETIGEALERAFIQEFSEEMITNEIRDQLASFLRCQRVTPDDLVTGDGADSSLFDLLVALQSRLRRYAEISDFPPMAGYQPNSAVSDVARMDLDALQIRIMLETQANEAARDILNLGRNAYSRDAFRFLSFGAILGEAKLNASDIYQIYSEYWASDTFASDVIADVINEVGAYKDVSRSQRVELGFRLLQGLISYIGIYSKLHNAVTKCRDNELGEAVYEWDSAVALFVGSGEGLLAGGRNSTGGAFLYALSEEICNNFGLCNPSGETVENNSILLSFAAGRDAVNDGNCEFTRRLARDEVTPKLSNLVVQGMLAFTIQLQLESDTDVEEPVIGAYVYAGTVIPLVHKVDSSVASLLEGAYSDLDSMSTGIEIESLIRKVAPVLRSMGIDCKDLDFPQHSLCLDDGSGTDGVLGNVDDQAPLPDTPTVLGDGLYVTTTFVQDRANIAKDVADMADALSSNNFNLAKMIYENGKNSEIYDEYGNFDRLRSLKSFSVDETKEMLDEPLFSMFMYALGDKDEKFMSKDVRLYADSLVEDSFTSASGDSKMLPLEATLALNVWMHLGHSLYDTLNHCKNNEVRDNAGIYSMDIAAAYWIGDGQIGGSGETGHLFYAMAERMGEVFNMQSDGQSTTNTAILKLFDEAKQEISLPGACSERPSSYLHLARIANSILSLMTVPLIQNLIHALRLDNRARVKIYAHAVVPLTAGCGPGPFEYLKEKLLDASYQTREVEDIVQRIRSIYPCLSLTCGDIGVHESELANDETKCQDPAEFTSMAGYTPASDVGEFSRLDLDMRQLDILLRMKAYSAADNLYTYGKHVKGVEVGSMSLFHLATSPDRTIVPEFGAFLQYYGKKYDEPESYADQIIRGALQNSDGLWSDAQRRIIVLKAAQVMVMYFGALQYLYNAVSQCQWATGFSDDWDRGAALLIGSLEGTAKNGTHEGYMFYELAQQHCEAFGTCTKGDSIVTINEDLISLLYMGRGAALSNSCSSLQKAANEIARLLLIPIVQGALHTAVQLTESASDSDLLRAEGYVFSRAVLPLVARAKAEAAETIDEHLGFPGPKATRRTASAVFAAFADVYQAMGVDCEHIGIIDGNDPCDGAYDDGGASLTIIIACVLLSVCVLYFCFTCLRNRRRHKTRLPENNPRFIAPAPGSDANHSMDINHSMDLLERAFASARVTPNELLSEDMVFDASGKDDDDFDEIQALVESRESDII